MYSIAEIRIEGIVVDGRVSLGAGVVDDDEEAAEEEADDGMTDGDWDSYWSRS